MCCFRRSRIGPRPAGVPPPPLDRLPPTERDDNEQDDGVEGGGGAKAELAVAVAAGPVPAPLDDQKPSPMPLLLTVLPATKG